MRDIVTAYIAIQGRDESVINEIKKYMTEFYDVDFDWKLPSIGHQKDWDRHYDNYKHRQSVSIMDGFDTCNGMFEPGAEVVIVQHKDPVVITILTTLLSTATCRVKLLYYSGSKQFDTLYDNFSIQWKLPKSSLPA